MRNPKFGGGRSGLLATNEPSSWTDDAGRVLQTLRILGRIKYRYPAALALRSHVFDRDGYRCLSCGCADSVKSPHLLDHIISRRNGGSHYPDNLQTLCMSCNASKAATVDSKRRAA